MRWDEERREETVEEILQKAMERLPAVCPQWTDHNLHDPGITCLELFAWLKEIQTFQIGESGEEQKREYLKLLGGRVRGREPARAYVTVKTEEELSVRRGDCFFADEICFEAEWDQTVVEGNFAGFCRGEGEKKWELSGDWLSEGRGVILKPFDHGERTFTIRLLRPLKGGCAYGLYLEFEKWQKRDRKPVDESRFDYHGFYPLASLRLEYKSKGEWKQAGILQDETYGFLQDGLFRFRLEERMDGEEPALRFTAERCEYLLYPVITRVSLAVVKAAQQQEAAEPVVLEGDGLPGQCYDLGEEGLLYESFRLTAKGPDGNPQEWSRVEDFLKSSPGDRHYVLDKGLLKFGDGVRGVMPKGRILASGYKRTLGSRGRVKAGAVNRWEGKSVLVSNERETSGGEDEETLSQALERVKEEQKKPARAVTAGDYEKLVMEIPGLLLEDCKAYINGDAWPVATLVVRPKSGDGRGKLNRAYERNLYRYLEEKRLLGTKIQLISPEYYELDVMCEAEGRAGYRDAAAMMKAAVEDFAASFEIGAEISFGALFGRLDCLPCVRELKFLFLDGKGKIPAGARGNLRLPPYGLAVLNRVECIIVPEAEGGE